MPRRKEQSKIEIKAAVEYILANDIPPKLATEILTPHYKIRSSLVKQSVTNYAPELMLQYLKWAERHQVRTQQHRPNFHKTPVIEQDKYLQALQKSGIYFEDITRQELCTRC